MKEDVRRRDQLLKCPVDGSLAMKRYLLLVLGGLLAASEIPAEDQPAPLPTVIPESRSHEWDQQLQKLIVLDFRESPLNQVTDFIRDFSGLDVVLSSEVMDHVGLDPSDPVTISLKEVPLEQALDFILAPRMLTYVAEGKVLRIEAKEALDKSLDISVYPVVDLVRTKDEAGKTVWMDQHLVDLITTVVNPNHWSDNGGASTLAFSPACAALVVSANPQTHAKIEKLLLHLRTAGEKTGRWLADRGDSLEAMRADAHRALDEKTVVSSSAGLSPGGGGGGGFGGGSLAAPAAEMKK
jgi:hypothetical protein